MSVRVSGAVSWSCSRTWPVAATPSAATAWQAKCTQGWWGSAWHGPGVPPARPGADGRPGARGQQGHLPPRALQRHEPRARRRRHGDHQRGRGDGRPPVRSCGLAAPGVTEAVDGRGVRADGTVEQVVPVVLVEPGRVQGQGGRGRWGSTTSVPGTPRRAGRRRGNRARPGPVRPPPSTARRASGCRTGRRAGGTTAGRHRPPYGRRRGSVGPSDQPRVAEPRQRHAPHASRAGRARGRAAG